MINKYEALNFLKQHQPMPPTKRRMLEHQEELCSTELMRQFEDVREYFMRNPSEEAIPLFLHSLGDGDGDGIYQSIMFYLQLFPKEVVIPHIRKALDCPVTSVRAWATEFSLFYINDDEQILLRIIKLLDDDIEVQEAALYSLTYFKDKQYISKLLKEKLIQEIDKSKQQNLMDAIEEIEEEM